MMTRETSSLPSDTSISGIRIPSTSRDPLPAHSITKTCQDRFQASIGEPNPNAILTGIDQLDALTAGFRLGELVVIGGRTSSGKSTLALNICEYAALKGGRSAAIFSMEMSIEQIGNRLLSSLGRVEMQRLQSSALADEDWTRIDSVVRQLKSTPIYVDDTPALTLDVLHSKCVKLKEDHGLTLVVVDYLQLMQVPNRPESLAAEFTEISRYLKAMAKELKIAIIAISQLSRYPEHRHSGTPQLSDLQWGSIEAAADVVLLLHRPPKQREDSPMIEVGVRKQRNGKESTFNMRLHGEFSHMEEVHAEEGAQSLVKDSISESRNTITTRPRNIAYIAKVVGYSIVELESFLENSGMLEGRSPTPAAADFLHHEPSGNSIWNDRLIDLFREKDPRR